MVNLEYRLEQAKNDNKEANQLITDYLPFIKKVILNTSDVNVDYDDRLSLAMLTFMGCIHQYEKDKGSFLAYASICIRNRLIDESRRERHYKAKVNKIVQDAEAEASNAVSPYDLDSERQILASELKEFNELLESYDITFSELSRICPKHNRSKKQCVLLSEMLLSNTIEHEQFKHTRRLPQKWLAESLGLSVKTIEKHRKYIVALVLLLGGDYPSIQAFLPRSIGVSTSIEIDQEGGETGENRNCDGNTGQ